MLRLFLVRHGQTDANLNRRIQGQSDGVLNQAGREQAENLGRCLKGQSFDRIISSSLVRARDTAAAVARHHHLEVLTTPLIMEWNCGLLDGITADAMHEAIQAAKVPLSQFVPEKGESLAQVRDRALQFIDDLQQNCAGETVLVCSHGDFMRTMLSVMLKIPIEEASGIYFDNASYTILDFDGRDWQLTALNQIPEGNHALLQH